MQEMHMTLARNVRRLRAQHGLTMAELARRCVLSRATVLQVESGRRANGRPTQVTLDTAVRLAVVLGVSLDQLVSASRAATVR